MPKNPLLLALLISLHFLASASAQATKSQDDFGKQLRPVLLSSPAESMRAIVMRPGFHVELVASEPLIRDPVAIDFDENQQMYVVELPQYNAYAVPSARLSGSIKLLKDQSGDGNYDSASVFADGLTYPTAIACWDGGLFVGDAPNLWYMKDSDGDGKADKRQLVFTGFGSDKAGEAHLNSIRWGFDNRFHLSTNLSGGNVRAATDRGAKARSVRGRGFVFDPRDWSGFSLTSGGGQHGLSMDDWGRKFVCSNSVPAQTLMYDDRYVARNPYVKAPSVAVDIAPGGKFTKLFRISPPEPWRVLRTHLRRTKQFRGSDEGGKPFGFFTGATGITIYRGDAWPARYRGNLFVGDVANNLVYRARLEEQGLGLVARRADQDAEFLASRDIAFRPVQFANAPDGNLFVIDMYRELIEGAAFLPPEFLKHLRTLNGNRRGRIYRIAANGARLRNAVRLGRADTSQLVALIEHRNGWHRDVASRLIYQRQDRSAIPGLRKIVAGGPLPQSRMTALYSLHGLQALDESSVLTALDDKSPQVRIHALRLSEAIAPESPAVRAKLVALASDANRHVRYQVAFSLGSFQGKQRNDALIRLIERDGADTWSQLAVLSSLASGGEQIVRRLAMRETFCRTAHGKKLLTALATQIGAAGRESETLTVLHSLPRLAAIDKQLGAAIVQALIAKQKGERRNRILAAAGGKAGEILARLLKDAKATAINSSAAVPARVEAVRSLRLAPYEVAKPVFVQLVGLQQPLPLQAAAVDALAGYDNLDSPRVLLSVWSGLSPAIRGRAADALLSRHAWIGLLLDAVERDAVAPGDIDPTRIVLLKKHRDKQLAARVRKVFADVGLQRRGDVVAKYQQALKSPGNAVRGRAVFKKNCSACHQLEGLGNRIGADLTSIRQRGMAAVMLNILDPNREVKPKYLSYVVEMDNGKTLTGMIKGETANGLTLQRSDGSAIAVQRNEIENMKSTGISFMPEGLEKQIDVSAMADLLAYLNSLR